MHGIVGVSASAGKQSSGKCAAEVLLAVDLQAGLSSCPRPTNLPTHTTLVFH